MKKIILLVSVLVLASCALGSSKRHEEFEYFGFNEKTKPTIRKADISVTKVTKIETLKSSMADVATKYNGTVKPAGSWEFSQKPSKTLKDEILNKSIELGANYVIMFEKKDCDTIDFKKEDIEVLEGTNCYRVMYYYIPEAKTNTAPEPSPVAAAPVAVISTPAAAVTTPAKTTPVEAPKQ